MAGALFGAAGCDVPVADAPVVGVPAAVGNVDTSAGLKGFGFILAVRGSVDFFLLVATLGEVDFVLLLAVLLPDFFVVVAAAAGLALVVEEVAGTADAGVVGVTGGICDCEPTGSCDVGTGCGEAAGLPVGAPTAADAGAVTVGGDAGAVVGKVIVSGCPGSALLDCDDVPSVVVLGTAPDDDGATELGCKLVRKSWSTGKRSASGDFINQIAAAANINVIRMPVNMPQPKPARRLSDRGAICC